MTAHREASLLKTQLLTDTCTRVKSVTAHRTLLEMEAPCERSLLAMVCDRALTEMRVFKATRVQYDKTKAGAVRSRLTGVPASQLHNELQKKSMRRTL